jgi:hypothetical protein
MLGMAGTLPTSPCRALVVTLSTCLGAGKLAASAGQDSASHSAHPTPPKEPDMPRPHIRRTALAITVAAAATAAPGSAFASSVSYEGPPGAEVLVLRAAPGEINRPGVQEGTDAGSVTLYDSNTEVTELPAACQDERAWHYVVCPAPNGVRLELGDGNDWSTVSNGVAHPVTMFGGPGDDRLEGNEQVNALYGEDGNDVVRGYNGDDLVDGGEGSDELDGYGGSDRLSGGGGDDLLHPDGYETAAADVVDGGAGVDRIESDWSTRLLDDPEPPVALTLGGGAEDGRPGEGDDIRGVERIILSKGGRVVGTDGPEYVKLHQVGDAGELIGLGGDDELRGGDGADAIDGGAGADLLDGGFGDDAITGGPGRDRISADLAGGDCGPLWCKYPYGNDVVQARDGEIDSITCGAGTDRVLADPTDTVAPDCETIERAGGAAGGLPGAPRSGGGQAGSGAGSGRGIRALGGQRLRTALRRGLKVRVSGAPAGTKVRVRALHGRRTVASGSGRAGRTVLLRFTAKAKRGLARKALVRLTVVSGTHRTTLALRR